MGIYGDYLNSPLQSDFDALTAERKKQLARISTARGGRDILVFAADLNKDNAAITIGYVDLLPINDQLSNLHGEALDLILETPGGSGEVAEDIVRILRDKYKEIAVVVPGWAKSAGTIMAMAADELLMGPASALGPIDAQLVYQGKRFSADALLDGMDKIKKEVTDSGILNKAYIPMLQGISPGDLQNALNARNFSKDLVAKWLATYKFRDWKKHSSTGQDVTQDERTVRGLCIAERLCDHSEWLTHGRSIKIADLREMRLVVTDYSDQADLADAINRYFALLQMTLSGSMYKLYETVNSQIYKLFLPTPVPGAGVPGAPGPPALQQSADAAFGEFKCAKCQAPIKIQANFRPLVPVQPGAITFPADNRVRCPKCGFLMDLTPLRAQIQAQFGKPVV
jgi:DNA-directed RNA polymerase subunit RPC12/RpoP